MSPGRLGPPCTWWTEVAVDGWAYVFVPTTSRVIVMNPVAALVWDGCDGTSSVDELVHALVARGGGQPQEVRRLVEDCVSTFTDAGLLRPAGRPD